MSLQIIRIIAAIPEIYTDPNLPIGEKLGIGAQVALMGLGIVFFVLALIWGALELFRVFFYDIPNRKKASAAVIPAPDVPAETVTEPEPNTEEVIAAITAAIAIATEQEPSSFRVVSFRKMHNKIR